MTSVEESTESLLEVGSLLNAGECFCRLSFSMSNAVVGSSEKLVFMLPLPVVVVAASAVLRLFAVNEAGKVKRFVVVFMVAGEGGGDTLGDEELSRAEIELLEVVVNGGLLLLLLLLVLASIISFIEEENGREARSVCGLNGSETLGDAVFEEKEGKGGKGR